MYILPGYVSYYEKGDAIYVVSKLLQNKVEITEKALQEEFLSIIRCGGCPDLSTPLTSFLHEQELLLDPAEINCALKEAANLLNGTLLLTIMPTEGCNFRCPYCYEDHAAVSMSRVLLDRIQEYITEQAPRFRFVQINWFGGEPTLCKDTILETSELIQSLQAGNSFQYNAAMTTNGYLLDADNFKQYYAAGITSYQITLDGWNHDQTRPHVTGRGTLQTILKNLSAISTLPQDEYQFKITLRHNILAGDEDFTWYDHLNQLFGSDPRFFASVGPVSNWGGESVGALKLLKNEEQRTLTQAHIAYLNKIGMQVQQRECGLLSGICYASYPHGFVFRSDGRIGKCTIALDHPKNLVGRVDWEKGVILDDDANRLWSTADLKQECCICPDVLSCLNMACKKHSIIDGECRSCRREQH